MLQRISPLFLFAILMALVSGAKAQVRDAANDSFVAVVFTFNGPSECPSEAEIFRLIERHTSRIVRVNSREEAAAHLSLKVFPHPQGYRGTLSVETSQGPSKQRELGGELCSEVVEALALTAALSVDPDASLFSSVGSSTQSFGDNETPINGQKNSASEQAVSSLRAEEVTKGTDSQGDPPSTSSRPPLSWAAGLEVGTERIMNDGWHLGFGGSLSLRSETARIFLPLEFQLGFRYLFEGPFARTSQLKSSLGVGSLAGCPLRIGNKLSVLACLALDLGWISAEGTRLETSSKVTRLFSTARAELPLRLILPHFEIWGAPGIGLPLTKRAFAVEPGPETISETARVSVKMTLGLRVRF